MSWRTPSNLAWLAALPGVRRQQPLAKRTSFNLGGRADFLIELADPLITAEVLSNCHDRGIPFLMLGAGTNLLVADAGVEGLVVRCTHREHRIEGDGVFAGAGLKMMRLARLVAEAGLTGFEFAIGVPGTVGGAIYQNAGCWEREVADVLEYVDGFGPDRRQTRWVPSQLGLGYRTSAFREGTLRGSLITGAGFRLVRGDGQASRRMMTRLTAERVRAQPIRTKNCGSVFKNPPGDSAGRLVEAAALKGAWEGAAQVSELHSNFIVNHGGATAADVDRLMRRIQIEVRDRFGVDLEPEVERVGRWA